MEKVYFSKQLNTITQLIDNLKCFTFPFPCKQISVLQKVYHESSKLVESFFYSELLHFAFTYFTHPAILLYKKLQDKNTFLGCINRLVKIVFRSISRTGWYWGVLTTKTKVDFSKICWTCVYSNVYVTMYPRSFTP